MRFEFVTEEEWHTDEEAIQVRFGPEGTVVFNPVAEGAEITGKTANPLRRTIRDHRSRPVTTDK
jgi:hypothetical protein